MAEKKKSYTQADVDNIVRKNMIETQLKLSTQDEKIKELNKQLDNKEQELSELKKREKLVSRALILADRRAKYIESTTRTRCAIEIENLTRFSEKWHKFFNELGNKYVPEDKEELENFDNELKLMIESLSEIKDTAEKLTEVEIASTNESKRLHDKENNKTLDDRFKKLCNEFDMKIGDNATRKPGRPKKNTGNKKIDEIIDELENGKPVSKPKELKPLIRSSVSSKTTKVSNIPKTEDSIFDFDEALNPSDDLESILSDLLGDDFV